MIFIPNFVYYVTNALKKNFMLKQHIIEKNNTFMLIPLITFENIDTGIIKVKMNILATDLTSVNGMNVIVVTRNGNSKYFIYSTYFESVCNRIFPVILNFQ